MFPSNQVLGLKFPRDLNRGLLHLRHAKLFNYIAHKYLRRGLADLRGHQLALQGHKYLVYGPFGELGDLADLLDCDGVLQNPGCVDDYAHGNHLVGPAPEDFVRFGDSCGSVDCDFTQLLAVYLQGLQLSVYALFDAVVFLALALGGLLAVGFGWGVLLRGALARGPELNVFDLVGEVRRVLLRGLALFGGWWGGARILGWIRGLWGRAECVWEAENRGGLLLELEGGALVRSVRGTIQTLLLI